MISAATKIVKSADICGGNARIDGTRIPVWTLVNLRRQVASDVEVLNAFPSLGSADLEAAWTYAALHAEEIAQAIRENKSGHDVFDIRARIDELKSLKAGWLDGNGLPPSHDGLDWLASFFDSHFPDDVPLPYLFPTPEGRVLAEWSLKRWSPSLEIDLTSLMGEWHALNLDTEEEVTKILDLEVANDCAWLVDQIRTLGGAAE